MRPKPRNAVPSIVVLAVVAAMSFQDASAQESETGAVSVPQSTRVVTQAVPSTMRRIYSHKMTFGWHSGSYVNMASTNMLAGTLPQTVSEAVLTSESTTDIESTEISDSSSEGLETALPVTVTPSEPTENPHSQEAAPAEIGWTKYDKVIAAHAVFGSVTWMLISPIAIVLARWSRQKAGPVAHAWVQMLLTSLLTVATVALGAIATNIDTFGHFTSAHQRMGVALLVLLLLQILVGRWAHSSSTVGHKNPFKGYIIHASLGVVLTGLGFAQVYTGFTLYAQRSGRKTLLAVVVVWAVIVGLFSVYLILMAVGTTWRGAKIHEVKTAPKQLMLQSQRKNASFDRAPSPLLVNSKHMSSISGSPTFSVYSQQTNLDYTHPRPAPPLPSPPHVNDNFPQSKIPMPATPPLASPRDRGLPAIPHPSPFLMEGWEPARSLSWLPVSNSSPLTIIREDGQDSVSDMDESSGDSSNSDANDVSAPSPSEGLFSNTLVIRDRNSSVPSGSTKGASIRRKKVPDLLSEMRLSRGESALRL